MSDFQKYLDKALNSLDVTENKNAAEQTKMLEYDIVAEISELIVTIRKESGMSQRQLSEKTGIPQANISKIENGNYIPSLQILKRLAGGLSRRLVIDFVDIESQMEE